MTDVHELPTAEKLDACRRLIAGLEDGIAAARDAAGQARAVRAEVALDAVEGNGKAKRLLDDATGAATKAALEAENLELALGTARSRLAALEAQAERERLEELRRRAVVQAGLRLEAGRELDAAIAALEGAWRRWRDAGAGLQRLKGERGGREILYVENLVGDLPFNLAFTSFPLRQALGLAGGNPDHYRPVVEGDPAVSWLRTQPEGADLAPARPAAEAA